MNEVLRTKINDSERMYAELGDVLADLDDAYKGKRIFVRFLRLPSISQHYLEW
ncbi:unnamed protein product [Cylicostephanus goldi]|uniref:Uncharacterized protein n=1 Tax=Cylicostephanus goldi TaxID=71465 RepID=A0A3P7MSJ1_CYLGO|nr:unnamed protein product [Cylicostephanus goldi]